MPLKLEPGATFGLPVPPCLRRRPTWSLSAVGGTKVWSLMQLGATTSPQCVRRRPGWLHRPSPATSDGAEAWTRTGMEGLITE
jgi:hypothetical protein